MLKMRVFPSALIHKRPGDGSFPYQKRYSVQCDDEPIICPEPPPKKRNTALLALGALIVAGAGIIGYAKYDDDFRQQMTDRFPFMDCVIKFVFQEEKSYYESLTDAFDKLKNGTPPPPEKKK